MSSKLKTVVSARNPANGGRQWPARICDIDEIQDYLAEEKNTGNPGDVLLVFLCNKGHNVWAWVPPSHISPYTTHRTQGTFPAESWANALRQRQSVENLRQGQKKSQNSKQKSESTYNTSDGPSKPDFVISHFNRNAHQFYEDELESPWQCEGCKRFTLTCECPEGLPAYIKANQKRVPDFEALRCEAANCPACTPPGAYIFAAEWEGGSKFIKVPNEAEPPIDEDTVKNLANNEASNKKTVEVEQAAAVGSISALPVNPFTDLSYFKRANWQPYWHRRIVEGSSTRLIQNFFTDGARTLALLYATLFGSTGLSWCNGKLVIMPELYAEIMSLDPYRNMSQYEDIIKKAHALNSVAAKVVMKPMSKTVKQVVVARKFTKTILYKGVFMTKKGNVISYAAMTDQKKNVIGIFKTELEAALSYDEYIKTLFPNTRKKLNFPDDASLNAAVVARKRLQDERSSAAEGVSDSNIEADDSVCTSPEKGMDVETSTSGIAPQVSSKNNIGKPESGHFGSSTGRKTNNSVSRQLFDPNQMAGKNKSLPGLELVELVSHLFMEPTASKSGKESVADSIKGLLRIQFREALKNAFGKSELCSHDGNETEISLISKMWIAHKAAVTYFGLLERLEKDEQCSEKVNHGRPNTALLRHQWQCALTYFTRLAGSRSPSIQAQMISMRELELALGHGKSLLIAARECELHRVKEGKMETPGRMREALFALIYTNSILPNATELVIGVNPRWQLLAMPYRLLRWGHEGGYLARLHYQCMTLSSSDDIAGTAHLSDCPLSSSDEGDTSSDEERCKSSGYTGRANVDTNGATMRQPDTVGCRGSWFAAVTAVTAVLQAVDSVLSGDKGIRNAFCAVRPPGHHAGADLHAMRAATNGFCLLNSAAIGAMYAHYYKHIKRVCVIDFDVHHGNGTEDLLCRTLNPAFFYASVHAFSNSGHHNVFPCTGGADEPNPLKTKNVLNIPIRPPVTSKAFHKAMKTIVDGMEIFKPELVILSAGFDAHITDPSSLGTLTASDFYECTRTLAAAAEKLCAGRLISVLEGGYAVELNCFDGARSQKSGESNEELETLSDSIQAHTQALAEAAWGYF